MKSTHLDISFNTILKTFVLIFSIWTLFQLRNIIVIVFIAFILMTAIYPLVSFARKHKLPILPIILVIYIAVLALLTLVVASLIPAVLEQSKALIQNMPQYLSSLENSLNLKFDPNIGNNYLSGIPSNLLRLVAGAFSNVLNIMAIFFITYYLTLERPFLHKYLNRIFFAGDAEKRAENMVIAIEKKVGGWVRGELILMLIIGLMTYGGLTLLNIPYALPLAMLAGILEVVPNLGPTIAAIPATLLGFTISPLLGLGAVVMSILIQQLENNLIVPRVMQTATGTKPLVTILVLLSGYTLGGVAGAILAMPLFLIVSTLFEHLNNNKEVL
ncbi:MAG: AI-2E family transporter [bacterium]